MNPGQWNGSNRNTCKSQNERPGEFATLLARTDNNLDYFPKNESKIFQAKPLYFPNMLGFIPPSAIAACFPSL
jgi:hypothetical protein